MDNNANANTVQFDINLPSSNIFETVSPAAIFASVLPEQLNIFQNVIIMSKFGIKRIESKDHLDSN